MANFYADGKNLFGGVDSKGGSRENCECNDLGRKYLGMLWITSLGKDTKMIAVEVKTFESVRKMFPRRTSFLLFTDEANDSRFALFLDSTN